MVKNRNASGVFQAGGTKLRLPGLPPKQCSDGLKRCQCLSVKYVQEVYVCVCWQLLEYFIHFSCSQMRRIKKNGEGSGKTYTFCHCRLGNVLLGTHLLKCANSSLGSVLTSFLLYLVFSVVIFPHARREMTVAGTQIVRPQRGGGSSLAFV